MSLTKLCVPPESFQCQVRGERDQTLDFSFLNDEGFQFLYLFPSVDSQTLNQELIDGYQKPIQLIIPDGTWRQTAKFHKRELPLSSIPHVKIESNSKSVYKLRRQKFDYGLCTHEALSSALGIIEGKEVETQLLYNLELMVAANLKARAQN